MNDQMGFEVSAARAGRSHRPRSGRIPAGSEVRREVDPRSASAKGTLDSSPDEVAKVPRLGDGALFEQGMADPRGCEYREVEVGEWIIVKTRGFVLPQRPGEAGRFVVRWDGVVYPALSVGAVGGSGNGDPHAGRVHETRPCGRRSQNGRDEGGHGVATDASGDDGQLGVADG